MINCLSFSPPFPFILASQLSRFKFPRFPSILHPLITIFFLNFRLPLISCWPPFRILLLMPIPCFVNYFLSLLFFPSASPLPSSSLIWLSSPPPSSLFAPAPLLNSPQVQSTSWMPHQQYVMQPTVCFSLLILWHVIYVLICFFSFSSAFHHLFL